MLNKRYVHLTSIAVWVLLGTTASQALAQDEGDDFSGWYVGGNAGMHSGGFDVDGYTTEVHQVSNIFVPGRGIVVVPGTTIEVAASSSGKSLDFQSTPCHYQVGTPLCQDLAQTQTSQAQSTAAFLGGLHFGFNKPSHGLLFGGEGEFGGSTFKASSQVIHLMPLTALTGAGQTTVTLPVTSFTRTASSLWSSGVTVHIGGIWKSTLMYGLGGPIISGMELKSRDTYFQTLSDGSNPCPCPPGTGNAAATVGQTTVLSIGEKSENSIGFGWTAGAGIEHRIWKRWSLAAEYRHSRIGGDFPATESNATIPDGNGGTNDTGGGLLVPAASFHFQEDRLSARINYRY